MEFKSGSSTRYTNMGWFGQEGISLHKTEIVFSKNIQDIFVGMTAPFRSFQRHLILKMFLLSIKRLFLSMSQLFGWTIRKTTERRQKQRRKSHE